MENLTDYNKKIVFESSYKVVSYIVGVVKVLQNIVEVMITMVKVSVFPKGLLNQMLQTLITNIDDFSEILMLINVVTKHEVVNFDKNKVEVTHEGDFVYLVLIMSITL